MVAGRDHKTLHAWGDEPPDCKRSALACNPYVLLPEPVDARAGADGDRTPGLGIVGLAGGVSEWVLDALHPFFDDCWTAAPLLDPACREDPPLYLESRGASFDDSFDTLWTTRVLQNPSQQLTNHDPLTGQFFSSGVPEVGFRCIYDHTPATR
jgi:hypothetical protein